VKQGLLINFLFSLYLACLVGLFVPVDIYLNNQDSTNIDLYGIFVGFLPTLVTLPFITLIIYLLLYVSRARLCFSIFVGVVSVCAWVNSTFLFGSYGQIDGRGLTIDSWTLISWIQISITFVIIFILYRYRKSNILRNVALSLLFIGSLSTIFSIAGFIRDGGSYKASVQRGFNKELLVFSKEKNVIHIILDELQSDVFENVIKGNKKVEDTLEGFVFFPDTISTYPTTVMSLPSMFSGEVYENDGGRREFLEALVDKKRTLPSILGEKGYLVSMHGGCDGIFSSCSSNTEKTLNKTSLYSLDYIQLIDLSLFKVSPDFLKDFIYSGEKWFVQQYLFDDKYVKTSYVGLAHQIFEKYNRDVFISEDSPPTYKVFHSVITHSPIWLDGYCQPLDEPAEHTLENKSNEALCALKHVDELIKKIKAMGIYDDTMFIISSDHGSNYYPESLRSEFRAWGIIYARAASTLLIKPFNSSGSFKVDDFPATLLDIPATILGALNIEGGVSGINLLSEERPIKRYRRHLYYQWSVKYEKENKLPPIYKYTVARNAKDPSSWTLVNADLNGQYIACNQSVNFNQKPEGYVVEGLSAIESWGRWSNSKQVKIAFYLPPEGCNSKNISFKLRGFVSPKNSSQRAHMFLNGISIGEVVIKFGEPNPREFVFDISSQFVRPDKMNVLEFHIDKPVSPKSVGINNDSRLLGLGFETMVFQ